MPRMSSPKPRTTKPKPKPTPTPSKEKNKDKRSRPVNDAAYKVKSLPKSKGGNVGYTVPSEKVVKQQLRRVNKDVYSKLPPIPPGKPADKTSFGLQGKVLTKYYKLGKNMATAFDRDPVKNMPARSHWMLIKGKNETAAWKKGYADQMSMLKKSKKK